MNEPKNMQPNMPPNVWQKFWFNVSPGRVEIAALIPLGYTAKPSYHPEYLARTYGLQRKYMIFTFDFKAGPGRNIWNPRHWRWQRQVKQFGTKYSVMVNK